MEVIPAIDVRRGEVVRLERGDYSKQTTFSVDPVGVAKGFAADGAPRLHVVDLDGALAGSPVQLAVVRRIVDAVPIPVQLGGGLRDEASVGAALAAGVDRVVLGTVAALAPDVIDRVVASYGPERLVVGLDALDGIVVVSGWTAASGVTALELMDAMVDRGARRFVHTDVARDRTLTSPNFDAVGAVVGRARARGDDPVAVIATGGIATLDHLHELARLGVEGAIVGSAVYHGTISLAAAVRQLDGA